MKEINISEVKIEEESNKTDISNQANAANSSNDDII